MPGMSRKERKMHVHSAKKTWRERLFALVSVIVLILIILGLIIHSVATGYDPFLVVILIIVLVVTVFLSVFIMDWGFYESW
ncbi:MAG: hypothetical protein ABIJ92_04110 [Candidatus Aenigmatarchaeota archaeon]